MPKSMFQAPLPARSVSVPALWASRLAAPRTRVSVGADAKKSVHRLLSSVAQEALVATGQCGQGAEIFGVIGDQEEIQGLTQTRLGTAGGGDGLPLGEAVGLVGRQPGAHSEGVAG